MAHTVDQMTALFQALADRTRLRLLNLMAPGEICVCFLVDVLDAPQPTISRHLAYLRKSGLVEARRDGKWMHYRIVRPETAAVAKVLDQTLETLAGEREMQRDRIALMRACCSPRVSPTLRHAPKPDYAAS
ncbi:MAG TPA: metalloregulator ArsR/SmtB family transcription factor [Thermoanaerobaculia bacterium]|nr:metalloregulator ArsR/SmtB family transcription factor [Thermoanaerobaculia bacterium]